MKALGHLTGLLKHIKIRFLEFNILWVAKLQLNIVNVLCAQLFERLGSVRFKKSLMLTRAAFI